MLEEADAVLVEGDAGDGELGGRGFGGLGYGVRLATGLGGWAVRGTVREATRSRVRAGTKVVRNLRKGDSVRDACCDARS